MNVLAALFALLPAVPVARDQAPPIVPTADGTPLEVNASYDPLAHYRTPGLVLGQYREGREL